MNKHDIASAVLAAICFVLLMSVPAYAVNWDSKQVAEHSIYLPYISDGPGTLQISTSVTEATIVYESPFTATATIDNVVRVVVAEDVANCLGGHTGSFWQEDGVVLLFFFIDHVSEWGGSGTYKEPALDLVDCMKGNPHDSR